MWDDDDYVEWIPQLHCIWMSYSALFWEEKQPKSTFVKEKKSVRVLKAVTEECFNNSEQLNRSE